LFYHPYVVYRLAEAHIEDLHREAARERRELDRFDEIPPVLKAEPARRLSLRRGKGVAQTA